jgi:repressor LexA
MPKELKSQEQKILTFIQEYLEMHGDVPTFKEIAKDLGYSHASGVQRYMKSLFDQNYLKKESKHQKSYELVQGSSVRQVPIVGDVSCGQPIYAEENVEGYMPVDVHLIKVKDANYFILRAKGDSMNMAGINDGDYVLVKQQPDAENGEKVVALINGEATIKKLRKSEGYFILEPQSSNPDNKPIILRDDFHIQGVVERVFSA